LLALVLAVALPAIGLVAYNIIDATNEARGAAYSQVRALASETASKLDLILRDNEAMLARLAERPMVRALNARNLDPIVRDFVEIYPELNNLGIRDRNANNIYSFRPNPSSPEAVWGFSWFREGIKSNKFTAGNAFHGRLSKRWVTVMTFPVRDDTGAVSGLINLSFDLLRLQQRVMRVVPKDAVITVLDREDKFLMRSVNPAEWIGKPFPKSEAEQVRGRHVGLLRMTGADGTERLYAVATVPSSRWRVFVGVPEDTVFAHVRDRLARSAVIGTTVLLLVLALAYRISVAIARPIGDLARVAWDIAKGGPANVQIKGAAEVEAVALEIDRLVDERERQRADRAALVAHYEQLVRLARDIFLLFDPAGNVIDANDAAVAAYGYSADELRSRNIRDLYALEEQAAIEQDWQASAHPSGARFETVHRRKDGTAFPVEVSARIIEIEGRSYLQSFVRDMTERKRAAAALIRQKELYNMLSQTNQAIVRCAGRDELFREICRIAVECGRFCFASIRLVDPDRMQLRNAARYGDDSGYLSRIDVSVSPEIDIGRGPTGQAIRTGSHVISNDFINDPTTAPWQEAAQQAGIHAAGAFPIRTGGNVVGAISLYSTEPGFFTEDILPTLDAMAADVSFALDNFVRETERKRTETELAFRTTVLSTQLETSLDAILLVDEDGKIVSYNQRFVEIWHIPGNMLQIGNDALVLRRVIEQIADPEEFRARVQYLYDHKDEKGRDEIKLKDGRIIDRYSASVVDADGRYYGRVWYFRDITVQKEAEERIGRLNLLYATLSGANSAVIRSNNRRDLCQSICRVVAQHGGWTGAWVGFVDESSKSILPDAWTDSLADFIKHMTVSVDPALPEGQGPSGIAARSGVPYFCNDVLVDPATQPWRRFLKEFGVASMAAVSLRVGDKCVGVIDLYSGQKDFYTPDVQSLVTELGEDVSFALQTFERERQRVEMENSLAESEAKYRGLVEQDLTGIYIIQDGKFVYVNPHLAQIFGYDENEIIGMATMELVAEPDRLLVLENVRRRIAGEEQSIQYAFRGQRKDGSWINIGVHGSRATYQGRPAVIGLLQDITERRKAEEQEKLYLTQMEDSMLGTIDAVSAMVEMRDPYTSGHERRVSEIAVAIATEMGLPESDIKGLRIAGLVHDIGKIACPAEILSKPAKLTPIEYELIKNHPQLGYDILKSIQFPWPIAQMVLEHHERLDGSGYPQKLKGDAIILPARILGVADTIEAMASHRPYRPGLGIEAALQEVEMHSGKLYDSRVVSACLRLFREKNYRLPD
jgi:PAS domain S-box-containing protein/putative nucleotidyltransferase with HDIG domain